MTSTQCLNERYLHRPMLSFDYNTNIDMINNVLNTPLSKGMKGKDVLTVITGLAGGKARIIEELKMKIIAEINNNTFAVSISYSLDWDINRYELEKFDKEQRAMSVCKYISMYMTSVGMMFTVISRLTRMLYNSNSEWVKCINRRAV